MNAITQTCPTKIHNWRNQIVVNKAILFIVLGIFLWTPFAFARNADFPATAKKSSSNQGVTFQGQSLASEIAKTTGYAINPLLCVAALGAYKYYTTAERERSSLPWHSSPMVWGPLALVMALIFLKDSSKIAAPKMLTLPLDAIETLFEKNISPLVALPILLSVINGGEFEQLKLLSRYTYDFLFPVAIAGETMNMALTTGSTVVITMMTSIAVVTIYLVVWVVSQAFNVLILLCPFSSVDIILAAGKNSLFAFIVGLSNTSAGMIFSICIILLSLYLFPKALRLVIFGTIMCYDIVFHRIIHKNEEVSPQLFEVESFAGSSFSTIPSLTYGTIRQSDGTMLFSYRPFYVFKKQTVTIDIDCSDCELINGFLSPILRSKERDKKEQIQLFRFRAKYCQHYEKIAELLGVDQDKNSSLTMKFQEFFRWCLSAFKKAPRLKTQLAD